VGKLERQLFADEKREGLPTAGTPVVMDCPKRDDLDLVPGNTRSRVRLVSDR
jgi:hypothetical protein